ncbi:hypothetical protein Tco_0427473 [Tanacetum coccineum]
MEPSLSPLPPQPLPLSSNNAFPILTHEMFCEHCQRTEVLVNDFRDKMRYSFLLMATVPADYVPAGHVLISADRYRIC